MAIAFLKISAASIVMGAAAHLTNTWMGSYVPPVGFIWRATQLAAAIGVGVVVLAASARILRLAEFDEAFARVLRRLRPTV